MEFGNEGIYSMIDVHLDYLEIARGFQFFLSFRWKPSTCVCVHSKMALEHEYALMCKTCEYCYNPYVFFFQRLFGKV